MSAPGDAPEVKVGRLIAAVILGGFMAGLDTSLVNVGLNTIATDLHASLTSVQWITSGYLLALAAALPAVPWLQDRFGASRLWLVSLVTFTAASVLCAVAPTLAVLIVARVLQGVSGGLLVPTGQNIVLRAIRPERMGRIMSTAGLALVLAPAIGPALGGLLIDTTSWRLLFLVNLPIGAAALILGLRVLPKDAPDGTATLDVGGLLLLSTGLPAISLGLTDLGSSGSQATRGIVLTVLGAALLVAFGVSATRRARSPGRVTLLNLNLFRSLPYATAQITVFCTGLSLFGGLILLPLYFEALRGQSVVHTGLLLLAYGFGAMAAMPIGGRLSDRTGSGITCIAGLTLTIVATIPFVFLPQDTALVTVALLHALRGVGVGLAGIPAMTAAVRAAPNHLADATTMGNILQRVGGSLGSAIMVITIAQVTPRLAGFQAAHAILAATAVVALASAVALAVSERRAHPGPAGQRTPDTAQSSVATSLVQLRHTASADRRGRHPGA
jgi:EmrB/QacA subfamily drug resistance transporter